MAIFAVIMSVNFTSCSDDDDNNSSGNIDPQRVFVNGIPRQVSDMKITRDASGLVSKIETDDDVAVFYYPAATTRAALTNQHVRMEVTNDKNEETFIFDMEIGENGFVKHCDEITNTWDFTYTVEGYLISMKRSEGNETTTITYKNGDIIQTSTVSADEKSSTSSVYNIDYTSELVETPIDNKGCIMLYDTTLGIDMDEMNFAFYAGLLGKATKHLPVRFTYDSDYEYQDTSSFTWTLNADGFPVLLSIQSKYNGEIYFIW